MARRCHGCGAWLHSKDPEEHGYVPLEARDRFSLTGRRKDSAAPRGVPVASVPDGVEAKTQVDRLDMCRSCEIPR